MTPAEMETSAVKALQAGTNITLVLPQGHKMPPKFPRGELLCESNNGSRCYSYDPVRILAWLSGSGLVTDHTRTAQ